MTSYWPAIFISLLAHALIMVLVAWGWQHAEAKTEIQRPNFIKATLVELEAKSKPVAPKPKKVVEKPKEKKAPPKKIDLTKQRLEEQRKKKVAAEQKRQQLLKKQEAEKAKKLAEQKAREAELARQQEEKEKREAEALTRERNDLLENLKREREQLASEQQQLALAQQAEEDEVLKQSYLALIQQRVEAAWSRPAIARNDMEAILRLQLVPTGEVVDVVVVEGSGNAAYDRSAVRAVKKVGRFNELSDMPSRLFEREFRSFKILFSPQDLRQ